MNPAPGKVHERVNYRRSFVMVVPVDDPASNDGGASAGSWNKSEIFLPTYSVSNKQNRSECPVIMVPADKDDIPAEPFSGNCMAGSDTGPYRRSPRQYNPGFWPDGIHFQFFYKHVIHFPAVGKKERGASSSRSILAWPRCRFCIMKQSVPDVEMFGIRRSKPRHGDGTAKEFSATGQC